MSRHLFFALGIWILGIAALQAALPSTGNFSQTNLVAWCIVPFDSKKRTPEERAAMLDQLGVHRLAYDWRAEHIPTFDAEVAAMAKRQIELTAWWFPSALNAEARAILECLARHKLHPQLWVTMGTEAEPDRARLDQKIQAAVETLAPICVEAAKLGSVVGLYNHLGWFGEPENQIRILEGLRARGHSNAGIVYNFHHGHSQVDRFPALLQRMQPHLIALNLNGMVRDGDKQGRKIIPLGTGDLELGLLQAIQDSGWKGPIGILGHTDEDAELKLKKELAGLNALVPKLSAAGRVAGEPAISGRDPGSQAEQDWVDNRWQQTDVGSFLASVLPTPTGTIRKGLSIRVGGVGGGAMAYDTVSGALRVCWSGDFLRFSPSRYGLTDAPRIEGAIELSFPAGPAWLNSEFRYQGHHLHEANVVLEWDLGGTRALELPGLYRHSDLNFFTRSLNRAPTHRESTWVLASGRDSNVPTSWTWTRIPGGVVAEAVEGTRRQRVAVLGMSDGLASDSNGRLLLKIPASTEVTRVQVVLWAGSNDSLPSSSFEDMLKRLPSVLDLVALLNGGASRWPALVTREQVEPGTDFLSVSTLTAPYDNPFKALLFFSGVDLNADSALFASTMHGDVWRVKGVLDPAGTLIWQRFATGLQQPLGLKVRNNEVFVLGRDRITRLRDLNSDGEADFYENFCDLIETSTDGHDFVTSLETDAAGRFYYVDPKGVHRVAVDGRSKELLATGWRNPNGMGVSPDGRVITVAPQQGTWTPSSLISEVKVGGYYGYGGPKLSEARPLGYDPHLCWIPHSVDNSSGSQVWLPKSAWGPLGGQMLHLVWGRSTMLLVLRDLVDGVAQGAVVPLPVRLMSGPNRATFHAASDSLFVAGSTGWQTNARKDGSVQRIRFTGKPVGLPIAWHAEPDGLILRFMQPLDRRTAEDLGSYGIKQWNYRYAQDYGSKDWSVVDPSKEGRDTVEVRSARLLPDGQSVRLEVPGLKPVMQMEVKYNLDTSNGLKPMRGQFWLTINRVGAAAAP